ncbi:MULTISPECIES: TolB family protein [unclassified Robiginitalea]|uniref:TolB family protein n=1 Tax=Robiginitalea TaxID=252306 RepID=UPI00234BA9CB|nr:MULTISPECIES: SMP-30/gluconolactonase/LRE family protein [unclassified Robiginitalea]MDC6355456.1 SMP-30/gluconolactonase/LRE family protein [Robiginitalea sp. PM2]MDC6375934.1 SMP-30/gluconolactonase/LRE family protein [Robiginitalea sp. SP8]
MRSIHTHLLRYLLPAACLMATLTGSAQSGPGIFDRNQDIGGVQVPGSAEYESETGTYRITGAGANMWFGSDSFHYAWTSVNGDFILRAEMAFEGEGADPHRKIGWMVRESLRPDAAHANACVHGDGTTALQYRAATGAETLENPLETRAPDVVQLERRGDTLTLSVARMGEPFESVSQVLSLDPELFAGLYVCSHNPGVSETATFRNVRIIKPESPQDTPYRDYLGSRLEVLDLKTGLRKVLFYSAHSIQAPNWTTDGKTLIYNSNGYLYTYDLESGRIGVLNTGFADSNNNDHVLLPDGSRIAISHHNPDDGGVSSIYHLPIEGSDHPEKVTGEGLGASYLHGWSADGQTMLFTGNRNGQYDIYAVDVASGKETQLTNQETLDDGSEYSPDGQWIYFNSNRTGTMQIWRMRPDGSEQTQLTHDRFNDWFPHVSPDGKQVVMISFPTSVPSGDHPFYKHCMLRIMPYEGGQPVAIAYVYGGQGTINVPSWSPDSRYIAFVTNSD